MRRQFLFILMVWAGLSGLMGRVVLAAGDVVVQPKLLVQTGPATVVRAIALSPDGRLEATGERRGLVRVWDWESGAELRRFAVGEADVSALAFSSDGKQLLCAAGSRGYVFNLQSGECIIAVSGPKNVQSAHWSAGDRQFLLSGFREVRVYNAEGKPGKAEGEPGNAEDQTGKVQDEPGKVEGQTGKVEGAPVIAKDGAGRTLPGGKSAVMDAVFSPDGRHILTGGADEKAFYIDVESGKIEQTIEDNYATVNCVAISPDGNTALLGLGNTALLGLKSGRVRFIDLNTFGETRNINTVGEPTSLRFSPDGQSFLMAASGDATRWISLDGNEKGRFDGYVSGADFSANGERIATAVADPFQARLWDAKDKKEVALCQGRVAKVYGAAFSPDKQWLATTHADGSVQLFPLGDKEHRHLDLNTEDAYYVAFSPDSTRLLVGGDRGALAYFDIASGNKLFSLEGHENAISGVGISGDGKTLISAGEDGTLRFWNAADGAKIASIEAHKKGAKALAIKTLALDGKGLRAVTGGADGSCTVWDIATREVITQGGSSGNNSSPIDTVAWSPDGQQIASGSGGKSAATLWNAQTGKLVQKIAASGVQSLAFEPNGARLFAACDDARLLSFEVGNDKIGGAAPDTGHEEAFWDACSLMLVTSPDGRFLAASGDDGLIRLRDLKANRDICVLATFKAGNWAVVDEVGHYDTSLAGGAASTEAGLVWSYQMAPISLDPFRAEFEKTGLLPLLLDPNAKPLPTPAISGKILQLPLLSVTPPTGLVKEATIRVQYPDGIGPVTIRVNGKQVTDDAAKGLNPVNKVLEIRFVPPPNLITPDSVNTMEVVAQNADKTLTSPTYKSSWRSGAQPGKIAGKGAATLAAPRLFVLIGGVSVYGDPSLNLKFAAKDARTMAEAMASAGKQLFNPEQMKIWLLTGEDNAAPAPKGITRLAATKPNFLKVFKEIQETARPDDVVFFYLAGHGGVTGQGSNVYFYPTQEAKSVDERDPRWDGWTITGEDISGWLGRVTAKKTVVVLDTCFSSNAAENFRKARGAGAAPSRAFERLLGVSGSHILAGCASNSEAYEKTPLGHGLLTYALLEGMSVPALANRANGTEADNKDLDITTWFAYAQRRVPELAQKYNMVQLPQALSPTGDTFPIGLLSETNFLPPGDETLIQLLQPRLRDETAGDGLGLEPLLIKELRRQALDPKSTFTFVNVRELPNAYRVSGEYKKLQNDQVTYSLKVTLGDRVIISFKEVGSTTNLPNLAEQIVNQLRGEINGYIARSKVAN